MNRRELLLRSAAFAAAMVPLGRARAETPATAPKKRILYFTRTVGYEHAVIHREGNELSYSERLLTEIAAKNNIEVECSKDGELFDGDISKFDGFIFFTNGDLTQPNKQKTPPMSQKGKEKFLATIDAGKSFVGVHGACGTWRIDGPSPQSEKQKLDPFLAMIGGEFLGHGPIQEATLKITSPDFPGMKDVADKKLKEENTVRLKDEWYAMENFARDMHVIISLQTKAMKSKWYERDPFPVAWARKQNKGRVFYTALGHGQDTWASAMFQQMLLSGLNWSLGNVDFDPVTNFDKVAPKAELAS